MSLTGNERHEHEKLAVDRYLSTILSEKEDIEDGTNFCL